MATVTQRIKQVKQPRGVYLNRKHYLLIITSITMRNLIKTVTNGKEAIM